MGDEMITKQEMTKMFMSDMKDLLGKYNAAITAKDHWNGYPDYPRDVRMTVEIPCLLSDNGNPISETTEINIGTFVDRLKADIISRGLTYPRNATLKQETK